MKLILFPNETYELLALGIAAAYISVFADISYYVRVFFKLKRLKPLDCEKCLGFWMGFIYYICHHYEWYIAFILGCVSGTISILTVKYAKPTGL